MDIKRIAFVRKGIEQQQYVKRYKISKNEKFVACALKKWLSAWYTMIRIFTIK